MNTQTDYAWASPLMTHKDATYFVGTNDYVTYTAIVTHKNLIQPITAPSAMAANFAAREWIDNRVLDEVAESTADLIMAEMEETTPEPEAPPKAKRKERQKKEEATAPYTFTAAEDAELVPVVSTEDW